MKASKFITTVFFLIFSIASFSQLKVISSGNVQIGGSQSPSSAKLNLYMNDASSFYSKVDHSSGWGDAVKSQVNRSDGIAFSAYYDSNRNFMVFGDGDVTCVDLYESSDSSLKENITTINSALEKIKNLRGVRYNWKNYNPEDSKETKDRIGLIAQEVQNVLPEVILTSPQGKKAISYSKIVAVLIEAIKELEVRIKTLENDCCNKNTNLKTGQIGNGNINREMNFSRLYQNNPNPFDKQTTIRFEIPQTVQNAQLHICNMAGNLLKTFPINQKGAGKIVISANEFAAGMYMYTLVTDGRMIDTKQMLLTK